MELNSVADVLEDLGLDIRSETASEYLLYCPFHDNTDSPAFAIDKKEGLWICFNASCGAKGNLRQLIQKITGDIEDTAYDRFIARLEVNRRSSSEILDELDEILGIANKVEEPDWTEEKLSDLKLTEEAIDYMLSRDFRLETLKAFEIGWSQKKRRVIVPVRDEKFKLVGVIGRTIDPDDKLRYLYSAGMPKREILFNLQRAKAYTSVILVEGSFDAMKVHQAGFPNVCAILGSTYSDAQAALVNQYFDEITVFADNDQAGEGVMYQVVNRSPRKKIKVVKYNEGESDPGSMTDEQIKWAVTFANSYLELLIDTLGEK